MRNHSLIPVPLPRILGPLLLAVSLCSCNLLIPENPSAPRYNSVLGGPRKPMLNPGANNGASMQAPVREEAPRKTAAMMATEAQFPPVAPETEMRAQEIMASDVPPPVGQRAMPMENAQPGMQVAQSNYPNLNNVPPTPATGTPDSAEARLARVRAQLEAERMGVDYERQRLATDAAAEPSLLNEPVPVMPPMGAPMPPQSSMMTPNGMVALPPPPPLAQSAGTAWAANAPATAPAMEPIVLRPPVAQAAPSPNISYANPGPMPSMSPAMAPAMSGGFNPMAGTEPINLRAPTSYAGSTSYLPNSRYSTRRN